MSHRQKSHPFRRHKHDAGERPPANESKPEPGEPSSDDTPTEDDEDTDKPKNFDADEAAKQFVEAFKQHIRGV
ncbi:primosomal replication protein N [Melittangium boletus DSM 14713]|uniref:Primosomal replication protein N n=1 Tax=Melittangium boletus DSM 14713 TaxID=1294270 RepID=A0A250IAR8_9BACT|nr:primosomal replication protein N [Melittangium boletus DSM 14713]